jgi:hypothetical protein
MVLLEKLGLRRKLVERKGIKDFFITLWEMRGFFGFPQSSNFTIRNPLPSTQSQSYLCIDRSTDQEEKDSHDGTEWCILFCTQEIIENFIYL